VVGLRTTLATTSGGHFGHACCLAVQFEHRIDVEVLRQVAPADVGRENPGLDALAATTE
jgi:hypothetical protein